MLKTTAVEQPNRLGQKPAFLQSVWWTGLCLLLAGAALGVLSLLFAIGPYERVVFFSYFRHPLILFLNLAPVELFLIFLCLLFGRVRAAYITTAAVVIGLSCTDYYLLKFRDDPLMFSDFINIREAFSIAARQKYDLTPDRRIWFGIACIFLGLLFISLFVRRRMRMPLRRRALLALIPAALAVPLAFAVSSRSLYAAAVNNDHTNQWSATQVYLSKGFVYPFLHSVTANALEKPAGYRKADAAAQLARYQDADIPEARKVSVVTVQLEAFADFSDMGVEGVDWEAAYGDYHQLRQESVHGRMLTNIFAGGTVNTERGVLTGFSQLKDFRSKTNSYAWYFADQGYEVTGSHPCYQWFYNRKNINRYLGFPEYWFYENRYGELADGAIAGDDVLMPDIFTLFRQKRESGAPVFSFNVTYQGHGPYDTETVASGEQFTDGRYSRTSANILNNYLSSVQDTGRQLLALKEKFAAVEDPVVMVIYGDHKPWLGDGNSVYSELGIDLDVSGEESLFHMYGTEYLIWANDAAKAALGGGFTGEGPDLSPNYLMNEVFDLCGWTGSAWMQATEETRRTLPVVTSIGWYKENGGFTEWSGLTEAGKSAMRIFRQLEYYWET